MINKLKEFIRNKTITDDLKGKPQYKMLIEAIKDICDWY